MQVYGEVERRQVGKVGRGQKEALKNGWNSVPQDSESHGKLRCLTQDSPILNLLQKIE